MTRRASFSSGDDVLIQSRDVLSNDFGGLASIGKSPAKTPNGSLVEVGSVYAEMSALRI
jgi:hypothetical protein